ncbi:Mitotic-spindle organizing protein 1-like [Homarus americanus]|uniref:Mitotic-spindle organizing protein 1-like n=1 Tax=Homarus americanus TaxID=6706 RepID=A0A8J5N8Y8_HOMAM|nr:Mitotic-spindle organizing protein 1-like [Homarus americanus]
MVRNEPMLKIFPNQQYQSLPGLDETTLALCVRLCDNGANPEALAKVITELQRVKKEVNGQGGGAAAT